MPQVLTHPTDDALCDLLFGKLPDAETAELEQHLTDCSACQSLAAASCTEDTFVELLAAARTRADADRSAGATPTLDGCPTPSLFAATRAWDGPLPHLEGDMELPTALARHTKYRAIRLLGIGGMGTVWLAEHAMMNREVAVKVIRPDLLAKPGATGRFLREVRSAAKLHHANIVTAFDAEPVGDSCLLVMEYVPGETLADLVKAGPMPVAEACRAIRDAARGLAHAHAAGLVHRDVKPHNLMRAADGTVKVLDFGLAGVGAGEAIVAGGDGLTGAGMVCGTPDYIAPEQIADPHSADARADIYGLGCTFYHLLSGRVPFPEGSILEKLKAQESRTPDPIPGLASDLAAALAKMLAKKPEDRYQSADEVVAALEQFCEVCRAGDASPPMRRRRWVAIAAGLLFTALLAVAGVVYKIQLDNQVITIATDDPDIEVVMKRKGEVLRVIDRKSGQTWELNVLTNEIGLADTPDGLKLTLPENESVFLRRQGKEVFRITRVTAPPLAGKSDKELILGAWKPVSAEAFGQPVPQQLIDLMQPLLLFTPDEMTVKFKLDKMPIPVATLKKLLEGYQDKDKSFSPKELATVLEKQSVEAVYTLDPTKTPKTIAISYLSPVKKTLLGIYSLEGDTLKICMAVDPERAEQRPAEFAAGAGQVYGILKRVPEAELPSSPKGTFALPKIGDDPAWAITLDGKSKFTIIRNGQMAVEGTYRITGDQIEFTDVAGPFHEEGDKQTGTYKWKLVGWGLLFTLVKDESRNRMRTLIGGLWITNPYKVAPPVPQPEKVGQLRKFGRVTEATFHAILSPDGQAAFAATSSGVAKYTIATGDRLWAIDLPGGANEVATPADGRFVLAWSEDGTARFLVPTTGKIDRTIKTDAGPIAALALSADGSRAATSHGDLDEKKPRTIRVWDVAAGKELFQIKGHTDLTWGLAFSPDGHRIATASYDGTLRLWAADTGKELHTFTGHEGMVSKVAFTPDGKKLVTCGEDTTVRVWDIASKKQVARFDGHDVYASAVAVTPDGTRVVSAGWGKDNAGDGLRVWDLATGKQLHHSPEVRGILYSIAITPDSTTAITAGHDGFVRVWRLPEPTAPKP